MSIIFERKWSMPSKNTFAIKPIRELIQDELIRGIILDPFANNQSIKNIMNLEIHNYISNDLDTQYDTDYNMDALEFLQMFDDNSVDMILYDPPYSVRQVSEVYRKLDRVVNMETTQSSYWTKQKKEIARIVKKGGKVISFGWNSGGIGKTNGFEIKKILLVPHGGIHNDTICTVEIKVQ